jgi:hypothetical protein
MADAGSALDTDMQQDAHPDVVHSHKETPLRPKTATVLIGAGAFSLALAGLVPTVVTPALLKAPAEVDVVTQSRSAAQKLNIATGELEQITVNLTRTIKTHADASGKLVGDADTAVYDELLNLAVVGADGDVQTVDARGRYSGLRAGEFVVAFDRKTGVGKPGTMGDTTGTTGQTVKFPFGTEKQTYQYFDQTSKRAWPMAYTRTTTVKGLEVYEFKGSIPETSLGQYGVLEGTDTLYSNKGRTVLVEPVTGSIVSSSTSPQTSIRFADGSVKQALLVDDLVPSDATVADRVADAKASKRKAQALDAAPWALGSLGLLLLGGGFLAGRRRESASDAPRPDVSGRLPVARNEPAVEPAKARR